MIKISIYQLGIEIIFLNLSALKQSNGTLVSSVSYRRYLLVNKTNLIHKEARQIFMDPSQ